MLAKLNESKAGKAGVVAVAVIAVAGAVFVGFRVSSGGDNKSASDKDVEAAAQKQIDVLEKENIPPALKAEMIAHQKGLLRPGSGPPNGPQPSGH